MPRDGGGKQWVLVPIGPHLLLAKGHPGTGKSVFIRRLAKRLMWPVLDKDHTRDAEATVGLLQEAGPVGPHDPGNERAAALNELAYQVAWNAIEEQLKLGISVIFDSPLAHERLFHHASQLAQRYGAKVRVLELSVPEEEHRRRIESRGRSLNEHQRHRASDWAQLKALVERYNRCWEYDIPNETRIFVDGMADVEGEIERVLHWLGLGQQ